jgi:hypothetical protein
MSSDAGAFSLLPTVQFFTMLTYPKKLLGGSEYIEEEKGECGREVENWR